VNKRVILVLILLVPTVLYLLLTTGKHNIKTLQYFGPKEVNAQGDTLYHTIPSFRFTDQDGQAFGDADLNNKIYIANFFFTSCPSICPEMQTLMKMVHDVDDFKQLEDLKLVSFTVDPEHDSVAVLKQFEKDIKADSHRWKFLTGNRDSIYKIAYDGYMANAGPDSAAPGGFLHSDLVFLIDRERRIRGIYEGTNTKDMKRLIDETKVLVAEYNLAKKTNLNPVK
jgi:protein SCO1/2